MGLCLLKVTQGGTGPLKDSGCLQSSQAITNCPGSRINPPQNTGFLSPSEVCVCVWTVLPFHPRNVEQEKKLKIVLPLASHHGKTTSKLQTLKGKMKLCTLNKMKLTGKLYILRFYALFVTNSNTRLETSMPNNPLY